MNITELLSVIEGDDYFMDQHIFNNTVVGFYKTSVVKYKNVKDEDTSYLFPTTFRFIDNKIETIMTFGSVDRNFEIPRNVNGTEYGTNLQTVSVGNHLYKLLIGRQENEYIDTKVFICIIEALDNIGFPFMRIANNESIRQNTY
jgi:hypothetical protein